MVIEKAEFKDLNKILELQKMAFQEEAQIYDQFHIPPLTQTLENIQEEFRQKTFLKALENNRIIGSVRANIKDNTCYIGRLIVHPEFQNQGIGGILMSEIEKLFSHAKRFELFTGNKSEKNIYLYKKLGYRIIKESDGDKDIKLVFMEKKL